MRGNLRRIDFYFKWNGMSSSLAGSTGRYPESWVNYGVNKCFLRVNDWHFWNPEVISYAMIPRRRPSSTIFFPIVASVIYCDEQHFAGCHGKKESKQRFLNWKKKCWSYLSPGQRTACEQWYCHVLLTSKTSFFWFLRSMCIWVGGLSYASFF
jgi:hypothetical protein